jgi:hypothetical protein
MKGSGVFAWTPDGPVSTAAVVFHGQTKLDLAGRFNGRGIDALAVLFPDDAPRFRLATPPYPGPAAATSERVDQRSPGDGYCSTRTPADRAPSPLVGQYPTETDLASQPARPYIGRRRDRFDLYPNLRGTGFFIIDEEGQRS